MGLGRFGLKSVEWVILMFWFGFFCFGGIVSDSCGPADTGSCIYYEILALLDNLGENLDFFIQNLGCIDVLVGFNVGVTGSW